MLQTHSHATWLSSVLPTLLVPLIVTLHGCHAVFPTSTDSFISEMERCVPAAQNEVDCLVSLRVGLTRAQTFMQDVHDVRTRLQVLSSVASTVKSVLGLVSSVPAIGSAAKAFNQTLSAATSTVDRVYSVSASIDDKLWPFKLRLDNLLAVVDRAKIALTIAKQLCTDGATKTRSARDCIASMPSGSVSDQLGSAAETFSSSIQEPMHSAVQAMSTSGSACSQLQLFALLLWPDMTPIKSALDSVVQALDPINFGLQKVKDALGQRVCLPISSPAEIEEEAAKALNPKNWFGKRRRNVRSNNDVADTAAEFAAVSASRRDPHAVLKRNWCGSVLDVVSIANPFLDTLLSPVQDILNGALSGLPSLQIPGLPDFTLMLNFDLSINLPSLDLGLDFSLIDPLANLDFQCPIGLSTSCSAGVTLPSDSSSLCSRSLSQYQRTTTTTASPLQNALNWWASILRIFG